MCVCVMVRPEEESLPDDGYIVYPIRMCYAVDEGKYAKIATR